MLFALALQIRNESESRSSQEINDMRCHKSKRLSSRSLDILAEIVTVDRIKWAISTMSLFKSPGREGIFPVLLQKGIHYLADPLQSIYRASLLLGYIPKSWRTAEVAFIPKPGRLDYTTVRDPRFISYI